ncbi:MAG TPA: NAD-dependent epimerase/dehydratase family protein [Gemmatimonadaceae bacterium]|nr:NAD-dependent epimerase/dehydratase family protein [Gemmatimonadaceae bacterium]
MPEHAVPVHSMRDDMLSAPRAETVAALRACPGDVVVLGAAGKMGPSLVRMVMRAVDASGAPRRVHAVSRWSNEAAARELGAAGAEIVRCDLLDRESVRRLPDAENVLFMAGQKFGTRDAPAMTWAMNTLVPAHCAERYRGARTVAFSTGNVYSLTRVERGGSRETDALGPIGEYACSCVGRERMFEYHAHRFGTPVAIVRLNYAIDVRYGVLLDIGRRVARGEPVSLDMGYVNVIWQGDANRLAIEALAAAATPPFVVNVTGPDVLSVRNLAARFGTRLGRTPRFDGTESADALLSNTDRMRERFAPPEVSVDTMIDRVAEWIETGGDVLGKPTHFEARDGQF